MCVRACVRVRVYACVRARARVCGTDEELLVFTYSCVDAKRLKMGETRSTHEFDDILVLNFNR